MERIFSGKTYVTINQITCEEVGLVKFVHLNTYN